jgi:hypothetical protein
MAQTKTLEGTGEELGRYLKQRPQQRFRLVPLTKEENEAMISPTPPSLNKEKEDVENHARETTPRPSALGKYSFVPGGSEEFAKEKQAEIAREDRARS